MTQPAPRQCGGHEYHWYPDAGGCPNEEGWKCCYCGDRPGEPPGYSPHLDRERIHAKVYGVLDTLHNAGLLYVSNGCGGDAIVADVAQRCREAGLYDQLSIHRFIIGTEGSHGEYWKKIGDAIMAGNDPRERCPHGKLASCYSAGLVACGFACLEEQRPSLPTKKRRTPRVPPK